MPSDAHRLLTEIQEQPQCLRQLIAGFPDNMDGIRLPGVFTQKLIGIGEGSSYNALKIAAPFIEELTGLNTFTFDPESLNHKFEVAETLHRPLKGLFEKSFFLTVSQSGKTGSILSIVNQLQEVLGFDDRYSPLLALTNNPEGVLGKRYGNHFPLNCGEERSIAATKSMSASLLALLLFGIRLGQKRHRLRRGEAHPLLPSLTLIPDRLDQYLQDPNVHSQMTAFAEQLRMTNQFVLLSKGILAAVLPEAGLKLTETSSNIVWTDNTESFKHGRKVILHGVKGHRPNCLYLIPPGLSEIAADQFFQDVHSHFYIGERQAFSTEGVFVITFENSPPVPETLRQALNLRPSEILTLPSATGVESLFLALAAFQLLSYYLAQVKGEDPNSPALQKAVTQ